MNKRRVIIPAVILAIALSTCRSSVSAPGDEQDNATLGVETSTSPVPPEIDDESSKIVIQTPTESLSSILTPTPLPSTDTPPPMPENQIAYLGYKPVPYTYITIFIMNPDGTNKRPLSEDPSLKRVKEFAWSSDGRQIVFSADPDGDTYCDIFLINANGTDLRLVANTDEDDRYPALSPNGLWVVFVSGERKLYLADVRNNTWEPILDTYLKTDGKVVRSDLKVRDLSWSPDSMWMGFSVGDTYPDVYQLNPRTGQTVAIAKGDSLGGNNFPTWSPDGNYIAYSAFDSKSFRADLYLIPSTGSSNPVRLTHHNSLWPIQPKWSQDSRRILYSIHLGSLKRDIYIMDVIAGNFQRITGDASRDNPNSDGPYNDYPSWSPDGEFVVFESNRDGIYPQIYRINSDGSNLINLTNYDETTNTFPAWQP